MNERRRRGVMIKVMVAVWLAGTCMSSFAASYTWNKATGGPYNWNDNANWVEGAYPDAQGAIANLTNNLGAGQTNYLNQASITIGVLTLGDWNVGAGQIITITTNAAGQVLILDNGGTPAQINQVSTSSGDIIAAPIQLVSGLVLSNASSGKLLTLSGAISGSGDITIPTNAVAFSPATDLVIPNNITGLGNIAKRGSKTLTLTGANAVGISMAGTAITGGGALVLAGSVFSNTAAASVSMPFGGAGNTLVVSNGVKYYSPVSGASVTYAYDACTTIVCGAGTVWDMGGVRLDLNKADGLLKITDDAVVTNQLRVMIGYLSSGSGADRNSLVITNGGRLVANTVSAEYIGSYGFQNSVWVQGRSSLSGAPASWILPNGGITIGYASTYSNSMLVGNGGVVSNVNGLTVGSSGYGNSLVITNGGQVYCAGGGALTCGASGSSGRNTTWIGGVDPDTLSPSFLSIAGALVVGNSATATNNTVTVDQGVITNVGGSALSIGGITGANNNLLVITNGGKVYSIVPTKVGSGSIGNELIIDNSSYVVQSANKNAFIGDGGSNNTITVRNNGIWDLGQGSFWIGSGVPAGAFGGNSNAVVVTTGGVITNVGYSRMAVGGVTNADFNSLTVTNGGRFFQVRGSLDMGGYYNSGYFMGGNSNRVWINNGSLTCDTDGGVGYSTMGNSLTLVDSVVWNNGGKNYTVGFWASTANVIRLEGAVATNFASFVVGTTNTSSGNSVVVTKGGMLGAAAVTAGGTAGGTTASGSSVGIDSGSILEANTLVVGPGAGNLITNAGGVYQFTSVTPAITNNGAATITLNGGVVSYRNLKLINVKDNQTGYLTNITCIGNNGFRLNNSTNSVAGVSQSYDFMPGAAPNYAGLELVNGNTMYTNGPVAVQLGGWLTFSNTAAIVCDAVTNNGTMNLVNSSVTFRTNLVIGSGCTLNWTTNSMAVVNGVVTLPGTATLNLSPTPGPNDQLTLLTSSNAINGSAANWVVSPAAFRVAKSVDGKSLVLRPAVRGFVVIVE